MRSIHVSNFHVCVTGFHTRQIVLAERLLASQEGLCCMDLVIKAKLKFALMFN
jgi:hypothetical protein